jgi:hypothetical protein
VKVAHLGFCTSLFVLWACFSFECIACKL